MGRQNRRNVVHIFASESLAAHDRAGVDRLKNNPTMGKLGAGADWTPMEAVCSAGIRAFFSPEKDPARISIDTIVRADDNGKMMFGLVNNIPEPKDGAEESRADVRANVELYHRSRDQEDVFDQVMVRRASRRLLG